MTIIKLITGSPDPALVAQDLRAIADLVERDQFLAAIVAQYFKQAVWPAHSVHYEDRDERATMAEAIRRFKPIATGPIGKDYRDSGAGYFDATIPLNALRIKLTDLREQVCTRVVTGVETVIEEVPDPEYLAKAPTIKQTRDVETFEWKCESLMAPAGAESVRA